MMNMKFIRIAIILLLPLLMFSCRNKKKDRIIIYTKENAEIIWNLLWNKRPVTALDTVKLKHEVDSLFTADTLLKYFGPGTQSFYLTLTVNEKLQHAYQYLPDLSWRTSAYSSGYEAERLGPAWQQTGVFYTYREDKQGIFKFKNLGMQRYEIRKGVDRSGKIIYPTMIKEIDINKYKLQPDTFVVRGNYEEDQGLYGIVGGYDALISKIQYPEEAKKNGVTGKVIYLLYLDTEGNIEGTQMLRGIGFGCDEAALKAIKQIRFYVNPAGKDRRKIILPIDFELGLRSKSSDLTCNFINIYTFHDPLANAMCSKLHFSYSNIGSEQINTSSYKIMFYIDGTLAWGSANNGTLKPGETGEAWARFYSLTKGRHEYVLFLDPDDVLHETNRENNVHKGMFVVN